MRLGQIVMDIDSLRGTIVRTYTDIDGFRIFVVLWSDGRTTHWDFATCRTCMKVLQ